jgi:hypothetical protein
LAAQKTAYQNYVAIVLKLLNWPDADKNAKSIVILKQNRGRQLDQWTPDEATTWFTLPGVTGFWAVAFATPKAGWLVGTDGSILKSVSSERTV